MAKESRNDNIHQFGNIAMGEVRGKVAYLLGIRAQTAMSKDRYLITFLPKLTTTVMKQLGIKSRWDLDEKIKADTRVLSQVISAAIDETRSKWKMEIDRGNNIYEESQALLNVLKARKNPKEYTTEFQYNRDVQKFGDRYEMAKEAVRNLSETLRILREDINEETNKDEKDQDQARLASLLTDAHTKMVEFKAARTNMNVAEAHLVSMDNFDFAESDQIYSFSDYVNKKIKKRVGDLAKSMQEYQRKYGVVPEHLQLYKNFLKEVVMGAIEEDFNISGLSVTVEHIRQYLDVLEQGPEIIQRVADKYPDIQKDFDESEYLWQNESTSTSNALSDEELNKARYPFKTFQIIELVAKEDAAAGVQQDRLGCMLYGPPGTAKTAIVKGMMKELGINFLSKSGPHMDETMLGGFPSINAKDEAGQFVSSELVSLIKEPSLFFLDEATAISNPAVRNQMATMVQSGEFSQDRYQHPLGITVLCANDNERDNPDIRMFSKVLMSRWESLYFNDNHRTLSDWVYWTKKLGDPERQAGLNLIGAFLQKDEEGRKFWAEKNVEKDDIPEDRVEPNFRTWYNSAKILTNIIENENLSVPEKTKKISDSLKGLNGPEAANAIANFYTKVAAMPDVATLIERAKSWRPVDDVRIFEMQDEIHYDYKTKKFEIKVDDVKDAAIKESFKGFKITPPLAPDKLNELYNKTWQGVNTNEGVSQVFISSQLETALAELFRVAEKKQVPVPGDKLDAIFSLAITMPFTNARTSTVNNLYNMLRRNENKAVLTKYGVVWHGKDGASAIKRYKDAEKLSKEKSNKTVKGKTTTEYFARYDFPAPLEALRKASPTYNKLIGKPLKSKETKEADTEMEI